MTHHDEAARRSELIALAHMAASGSTDPDDLAEVAARVLNGGEAYPEDACTGCASCRLEP